MSVLKTLTENIVKRDLSKDGAALLTKWEKTGLLEGLTDDYQRNTLAVLLENQAKELLREATTMAGGDVEGYAAVAFPIVRRVFGGLIANDLVSVQPMSLPSGLVFFLDFTKHAPEGSAAGDLRDGVDTKAGDVAAGTAQSIYGGGQVGSGIMNGLDPSVGGVYNLQQGHTASRGAVNAGVADLQDPSGVGCADTGVSAVCVADAGLANRRVIALDGNLTEAEQQALGFDADLLADTSGTEVAIFRVQYMNAVGAAAVLGTQAGALNGSHPLTSTNEQGDLEANIFQRCMGAHEQFTAALAGQLPANPGGGRGGLSHINVTLADGTGLGSAGSSFPAGARVVRRLTRLVQATGAEPGINNAAGTAQARYLEFVIAAGAADSGATMTPQAGASPVTDGADAGILAIEFAKVDNLALGTAMSTIQGANSWEMEDSTALPEIDIAVDSAAITAATRKLKARWTPELAQDLNAYHNLDAEVELTGVLSEHIALEIDQEILGDLIKGATADTFFWSRRPGMFVNRTTGADITSAAAPPDFTGTVSEWYETLIETINDVSASIHRKTLRGGANFLVCGPEVANILEFTSGFRASVTHDDEKGSVGAVSAGSINKKWDLIVDPYFPRNVILVGRKGGSFLESGYVYAPYVPLQVTPTIFDPDNFTPRKAVMTRYGKRMVNPDMYGLVLVRDLQG